MIETDAASAHHHLTDPLAVPMAHGPVSGSVSLPGSKSISNRVLPMAALARGRSVLDGVLDSDDTRHMLVALQALGFDAEADWTTARVTIDGRGGTIPASSADLFLGNSGTSVRFLTALVALGSGDFRIDGTPRMRQRPLAPLVDGLRGLGVSITHEGTPGNPPLVVHGQGLPGGTIRMRGDLSSQYFSALAMVAPYATERLTIEVDGTLVSQPYLDMTAATMRDFGVELQRDGYERFWTEPQQTYAARDYLIEPDASAASYFFALAAVTGGSITVERLGRNSIQGDMDFIAVLTQMGCTVSQTDSTTTVTGPATLRGIDVDMNAISDTMQTLAAIAPFADGPVTVRNVEHIRGKETDRVSACVTEMRRMGITVEERADGLTITPGTPQPATIQTYDDHRMAMSFALTGVRASGIRIADPACVAKTVPTFWSLLFPLLGAAAPG